MSVFQICVLVIASSLIVAFKLADNADNAQTRKMIAALSEDQKKTAEMNAEAAANLRREAEAKKRTAEAEARIEELKLERTKLLMTLSDADREAFERLLAAPLVKETQVYPVPVPVWAPPPPYFSRW